jgi:hypothetical protein
MKFKNIKKKTYRKKSPSNSRSITESKQVEFSFSKINSATLIRAYGGTLKVFVIMIFIVAAAIVGYDFKANWKTKQSVDLQRERLGQELSFWKDFITKHQNYRDAYFQASVLEYRLGNTAKAKVYAEKGLALDPNSTDGRNLEKFLAGK